MFVRYDLETVPVATAGEIPRGLIRSVIEFLDGLIDTFPGRRAHIRFTVDNARHGLDRNAGKFGYVEYSGIWHQLRD